MVVRSSLPTVRPEAGVSMVEFSLVLVMFMVLLSFAFDAMRVVNARLNLQHAAAEGLRKALPVPGPSEARSRERIAEDECRAAAVRFGLNGATCTAVSNLISVSGRDFLRISLVAQKRFNFNPVLRNLFRLGGVYKNGYLAKANSAALAEAPNS